MIKTILLILLLAIAATGADFISVKYQDKKVQNRATYFNSKIEEIKKISSKVKQLEEINKLFNSSIRYTSDKKLYNKKNYIATVEETIKSMKGDCDDYVMAKIQAISHIGGFKNVKLLYSTERGVRHVKIVAKANNKFYVLDNLNKKFRTLTNKEGLKKKNKYYNASLYIMAAKQKNKKFS